MLASSSTVLAISIICKPPPNDKDGKTRGEGLHDKIIFTQEYIHILSLRILSQAYHANYRKKTAELLFRIYLVSSGT